MSILEQVMQMKEKGIPENEILGTLQEKGVAPKAIQDALSQAQIKQAVSEKEDSENGPPVPKPPVPSPYVPKTKEISEEEIYVPKPQETPKQESYPQYPPEQPQQFYQQENYGSYPEIEEDNTNTLIEISEQVFSEKIQKIQKQVENFNEFKALAQIKIESSEKRLQRMENMIDKLQISILEKIGSYGENLGNIKKEMSMMQDSFTKMINPLADKIKKHPHTSKKRTSKKK